MKAFFAGLGIGVGVGILFAPASGEVTRTKVQARLGEWSESLRSQIVGSEGDVEGEPSNDTQSASASPVQDTGGLPRKKDPGKEEAGPSGGIDQSTQLVAMT
jgi:gas vesicle protein